MYEIAVGVISSLSRCALKSMIFDPMDSESEFYSNSFLAGRALLLRMINSEILPKINYHYNGKPYFEDEKLPFFNISHSGNYVAIVLSDEGAVGCDLEVIRPRPNWPRLANYVFNNKEICELEKITEKKVDYFWHTWTSKEAILKQQGGSLSDLINIDTKKKGDFFVKTYSEIGLSLSICTSTFCDTPFPRFLYLE